MKFAYLGEGAGNWDKIASQREEGGGINSAEGRLLEKRIDDFISTLSSENGVNIIDIGCGNGYPVFPILKKFIDNNIKFKYVPLDISQEMLDLATKNVKGEFPETESQQLLMDFELGQFSDITYELKKDGSVNLMLFLGSTLGNHSDLNRVLSNFRDSMSSKDYMIVGVELTNLVKVQNITSHYKGKVVEDFVSYTLDHIGVKENDRDIEISWNSKDNQVEIRAVLNKNVEIKIAEENFVLYKGEKILLSRSKKFSESVVTQILSDVGFRTELLTTNEERGYLLTMVQPTRYSI